MSTLIILLLCGAAGGFIFEWFGLPGGAMTGAIIAVILLKSFSSLPQAAFPRPFQFCIYAGLGVLVGNMYRPEMLLAVRDTWPVLVISTLLVLVAGMLIAIFVVKFGNLDVTSAYLATSPGVLSLFISENRLPDKSWRRFSCRAAWRPVYGRKITACSCRAVQRYGNHPYQRGSACRG